MRDTHDEMIELLASLKENNQYFTVIKHRISDEYFKLRFAINPADYGRLKRILESRPFENTGVAMILVVFSLLYCRIYLQPHPIC